MKLYTAQEVLDDYKEHEKTEVRGIHPNSGFEKVFFLKLYSEVFPEPIPETNKTWMSLTERFDAYISKTDVMVPSLDIHPDSNYDLHLYGSDLPLSALSRSLDLNMKFLFKCNTREEIEARIDHQHLTYMLISTLDRKVRFIPNLRH